MRPFIFIILVGLSIRSFGQTPDYFANEPRWRCGEWYYQVGSVPTNASSSNFVYYLNGDSTIGNYLYHRLYRKGWTLQIGQMTFTNYFDSFTGYFLRQEGRSIRFYNDLIGSDSLLVSYEYQVGDTVRGDIFYPCGFSQNTIQRVDSVLINSEYRKVFYIDSISGPVITEGIGHQLSTYSEGEFIKPLCEGGFGTGTSIFCYGLGETPYWSSENETGNCSVMVGLESINSVDFKIYPNPFVAETTLEFDNSMIGAHIIVVDLQGQVVKQLRTVNAQRIVIHRDDLPAGLYFIRLTKDSGVTKTMKIAIID